ncbi:NUDIX domain-containing protein [Candidatus Uhrbacteria bacterium]|nr:NUDIX domain-containing protein [Candidatus Uhrbacteria bacterium]
MFTLIFGTFDRFHEGHRFFLDQAIKEGGGELVVSVALDDHVRTLKKKEPTESQQVRLGVVSAQPGVRRAVLSDEALGAYGILSTQRIRTIVVGYDQQGLWDDLQRFLARAHHSFRLVRLTTELVSVALFIPERDGWVFLQRRKDPRPEWNAFWEFPGGKIAKQEDPALAAARELTEETALDPLGQRFLGMHEFSMVLPEGNRLTRIYAYAGNTAGKGVCMETDTAADGRWFPKNELLKLPMLPPNKAIVRKLYLNCCGVQNLG